jgi:hypothetical protein
MMHIYRLKSLSGHQGFFVFICSSKTKIDSGIFFYISARKICEREQKKGKYP